MSGLHEALVCAGTYADKILMEKSTGTGQRKRQAVGVSALTAATSGGRQFRLAIRAKCVVSSAGSLHTPALLLRSKITCRGNVGRNLHLHPATAVFGLYQKVLVSASSEPPSPCMLHALVHSTRVLRCSAAPYTLPNWQMAPKGRCKLQDLSLAGSLAACMLLTAVPQTYLICAARSARCKNC